MAGAAHQNASRLSYRFAWPSGEWGSLPLEGGIEAAYKAQLEAADDPDALRAEIETRLARARDPFKTAEAFLVEEIVDPRETRPLPLRVRGPRGTAPRTFRAAAASPPLSHPAPVGAPCRFARFGTNVTTSPRSAGEPVRRSGPSLDFPPMATTSLTGSRPADGFWPNAEHWSVEIPLDTPHPRPAALAQHGCVQLADAPFEVPEAEYLGLEYMDWKSGGDTNFAPIATADGQLDCRGFWNEGDERPDKDAIFTSNALPLPDDRHVRRERRRQLRTRAHDQARAAGPRRPRCGSFHRDDNNRFNPSTDGWVVRAWLELTDNPDSYMLLMESGADGAARPGDRDAGARCTAARGSSSTRSGCGTSSCTTAPRRGTR